MPLDSKGRCCGQKVLSPMTDHQFCRLCDRQYNEKNDQVENWAWKKVDGKWNKIFGEKPVAVDDVSSKPYSSIGPFESLWNYINRRFPQFPQQTKLGQTYKWRGYDQLSEEHGKNIQQEDE